MTRNDYFARRAALTGEPMPALFHVSFNIGGRVVSDRVRGYMAAVARLDLLVEEAESTEQAAKRRIVLATNCKVREVKEIEPYVRATMAVMRGMAKGASLYRNHNVA